MENNQSFEYIYSAERQREIERLRQKYLPPEEDKMETLRRLHYSATRRAQAVSISLGVIGTLIFGTGLSLILTELGAFFGEQSMFAGVAVGLVGLILLALAYPVYNRVLKKERARIAPEILRLTEELLK